MVLLYNEKTKKKRKKKTKKKIPAYFKIDCIILKPICFFFFACSLQKKKHN